MRKILSAADWKEETLRIEKSLTRPSATLSRRERARTTRFPFARALSLRERVAEGRVRDFFALLHRESRTRIELFPVLSHGIHPDRRRRSVSHGISGNGHLCPHLQIAGLDAGALQSAWSFGFESPHDLLTVFIDHFHVQPRMRVGQFPLRDHTLEGYGSRLVKHCRGVVSGNGYCTNQNDDAENAENG